jgi:hypothetical protein
MAAFMPSNRKRRESAVFTRFFPMILHDLWRVIFVQGIAISPIND